MKKTNNPESFGAIFLSFIKRNNNNKSFDEISKMVFEKLYFS